MHLRRSFMTLGSLAVLSAPTLSPAAAVYKWTDADGVVHFSDQPEPGAEKIVTDTSSSHGIMSQPVAGPTAAEKKPPASSLAAAHLAITSPAPDETFTGDRPVPVHLDIEPTLKPNQTVTWTLNGVVVSQSPDATQFTLTDLARGSYTLAATVADPSGDSKSADPVTFNVVRPSVLSPQHK